MCKYVNMHLKHMAQLAESGSKYQLLPNAETTIQQPDGFWIHMWLMWKDPTSLRQAGELGGTDTSYLRKGKEH